MLLNWRKTINDPHRTVDHQITHQRYKSSCQDPPNSWPPWLGRACSFISLLLAAIFKFTRHDCLGEGSVAGRKKEIHPWKPTSCKSSKVQNKSIFESPPAGKATSDTSPRQLPPTITGHRRHRLKIRFPRQDVTSLQINKSYLCQPGRPRTCLSAQHSQPPLFSCKPQCSGTGSDSLPEAHCIGGNILFFTSDQSKV